MRRALSVAWLIAGSAVLAKAQIPTPEAAGLGQATVAHDRVWGAVGNPAVQPYGESRFAAQAYGTTFTGPVPLPQFGLDLGYETREGGTSFQVGVQHFAPPGYAVTAIRFGANRPLADNFEVGLRVGVLAGNYAEYGSELLPIAEGGIAYRINPTLRAGAHYTYVERSFVPMAQRRLQVGIDYESSKKVSILVAASQAVSEPLNGQVGISYAPAERLRLLVGFQTVGQRISFGSTFAIADSLSLKLAAVIYSQLPVAAVFGMGRG